MNALTVDGEGRPRVSQTPAGSPPGGARAVPGGEVDVRHLSRPPRPSAQRPPLVLAQSAPDTGLLPAVEGPLQARLRPSAPRAHRVRLGRLRDRRTRGADREEQLWVLVRAGGPVAPVHRQPSRRAGPVGPGVPTSARPKQEDFWVPPLCGICRRCRAMFTRALSTGRGCRGTMGLVAPATSYPAPSPVPSPAPRSAMSTASPADPSPSIDAETAAEIEAVNASGRTPVVFIHGLWLLPSSWDRWAEVFEQNGYAPLTPGWPDDPQTVEEAKAHPDVFANKTIGDVADHYQAVIGQLKVKPAVIGHSFGGLLTQIVAGRGLSACSVAIDPAPFRGVLPLPLSALRSSSPVLSNPRNRHRAVPLTFEQFRYAFANAVEEDEARQLYDTFAVPAPGEPLFQAAAANLNPWTEAKVDTDNPDRGPLLIISGEKDHTVPRAIAEASYKRQKDNKETTEFVEIPGRGHALTIDSGWHEVAATVLDFVRRFVK